MAFVDHALSIPDKDIMMENSYIIHNKSPIKAIALAIFIIVFGTLGIVIGSLMTYYSVSGVSTHGLLFSILGNILFSLGSYCIGIAYYAYKEYKGLSFSNIPPV